MKISKNLEWTREYLKLVKDLISLKGLKEIRGIGGEKINRCDSYLGLIVKDGRSYTITLMLGYQAKYKPFGGNKCHLKRKPLSKIDLLCHLAHELAHLASDFEHTPKHKVLECMIIELFMYKLFENDYVSEEVELG